MLNWHNISKINDHYQVLRKIMIPDSDFINKRIVEIKSSFLCKQCLQKYRNNLLKTQSLVQHYCPDFEITLYSNKQNFTIFQKEMLKICIYSLIFYLLIELF